MKRVAVILLLIIVGFSCAAQAPGQRMPFWRFVTLNGEVKLDGHYREQRSMVLGVEQQLKNYYFSGGVSFNTKSYVWHRNFLIIDFSGDVNPGGGKQDYLISPDVSEVGSSYMLDLRTTFFNSKIVSVSGFGIFNQNIINRENLTNVRSKIITWGGSADVRWKYLPLKLNYTQSRWDQTELQTDRTYSVDKMTIEGKIFKSFTKRSRNELSFTHDENDYVYDNLLMSDVNVVSNRTERVYLNNSAYVDEQKKYNLRSIATYLNQRGYLNLSDLILNESATLRLPENFDFLGRYEFVDRKQMGETLLMHRVNADVKHSLFSSLNTRAYGEYVNLDDTRYLEFNYRAGASIRYEKKIPLKGILTLSYHYFRYHENMNSSSTLLSNYNEQHTLNDGEFELLNKPYVEMQSVVVKDETGSVFYQLGLDYELIEMNDFIEIRRIPAGQILDGALVFVDYESMQPGVYSFNSDNHRFRASISLFKRFIELYYQRNEQDYRDIRKTEFLALNYFTQNLVGARFSLDFANAGMEYDMYKSTNIPYRMFRYYLQVQKNFKNRLLVSLNGNVRDYRMLDQLVHQIYIDASARVAYSFKEKVKLSFDVGYRKQIGEQIDLSLVTGRLEGSTVFRMLKVTLGVDAYNREYLNEPVNYWGIYFRVSRKFKLR